MRTLGNLLITISLVVGALAAATAYTTPLNQPDARLLGVTLGAPAGAYLRSDPQNAGLDARAREIHASIDAARRAQEREPLLPVERITVDLPPLPTVETSPSGEAIVAGRERLASIGRAGDPLTPELLALLREQGVEIVKTKEFSLRRWRAAWVFGLALVGLTLGAGLVRTAGKRAVAAARAVSGTENAPASSPAELIEACRRGVTELRRDLASLPGDKERLDAIVDRLGNLQQTAMTDFVAMRPRIISERGLGGFASIMDAFAVAERSVNRAWSAAADECLAESLDCLSDAEALFDEAVKVVTGAA